SAASASAPPNRTDHTAEPRDPGKLRPARKCGCITTDNTLGGGLSAAIVDEHTPVLVGEALAALALQAGGYYVDATFGRGGHTALILQALGREGRVLAIDRDPQA